MTASIPRLEMAYLPPGPRGRRRQDHRPALAGVASLSCSLPCARPLRCNGSNGACTAVQSNGAFPPSGHEAADPLA